MGKPVELPTKKWIKWIGMDIKTYTDILHTLHAVRCDYIWILFRVIFRVALMGSPVQRRGVCSLTRPPVRGWVVWRSALGSDWTSLMAGCHSRLARGSQRNCRGKAYTHQDIHHYPNRKTLMHFRFTGNNVIPDREHSEEYKQINKKYLFDKWQVTSSRQDSILLWLGAMIESLRLSSPSPACTQHYPTTPAKLSVSQNNQLLFNFPRDTKQPTGHPAHSSGWRWEKPTQTSMWVDAYLGSVNH